MKRGAFPHARAFRDRHGRTRWRYRRKGFERQLGAAFGSDEFKRRYAEAEAEFAGRRTQGAGADLTAPGSMADLIASYYRTPAYRDLSDSTKRTYRAALEWLRVNYGHLPVTALRRRHVEAMQGKLADTPAAANNLRKRLAQLLDHAIALDWITVNPARLVRPFRLKGEGFHPWDEGEIARFFEAHPPGTMAHRAVVLMLYTGAARVDAVRLGPWNIKAGRLEYRRQKTLRAGGQLVSLPLHPDLAAVLDGLPDDRPFLATADGKPRSAEGLGNAMRKWCDAAGLTACTAHGLRKAIARRLAEAGATAHQIMAVTGHKTLAEVQRYTDSAARETLADEAIGRLADGSKSERNVVNLPHRFPKKSTQAAGKKGE